MRQPHGRLMELPLCALEWAVQQITEYQRSRHDIAHQLQIDRRTLDRSLAKLNLQNTIRVRCDCGAITLTSPCPNGHLVPFFHLRKAV